MQVIFDHDTHLSDGEEKEQAGEIFALNTELHKLIYFQVIRPWYWYCECEFEDKKGSYDSRQLTVFSS
jgi:hypothetical protein